MRTRILRKSVPNLEEMRSTKVIPGDGIEIALLPRFLTIGKLQGSVEGIARYLTETPDKYFGLETFDVSCNCFPYFDEDFPLNPISRDSSVKEKSQYALRAISKMFIPIFEDAGKSVYLQIQATGDSYDANYRPSKDERRRMAEELAEFTKNLQNEASVKIMIENQNRVALTSYHPGYPVYNTIVGTRLSDWDTPGFPKMVFDAAHLALDLYTIGQGVAYPDGVQTSRGKYVVNVEDDERDIGRSIAELIIAGKKKEIRDYVSSLVIDQMIKYREQIEVVHLNGCGFVGVEVEREEGLSSLTVGMLDLERVLDEGVRRIDPVFVVPEVSETNYKNPVNQKSLATEIQKKIQTWNTAIVE